MSDLRQWLYFDVRCSLLTVQRHIEFKLCLNVCNCLCGISPSYGRRVSSAVGRHYLRSAAHCDLITPRTRLIRCGPRSLAVSGPVIWNSYLADCTRPVTDFCDVL